jgi:hypothetical protein
MKWEQIIKIKAKSDQAFIVHTLIFHCKFAYEMVILTF